MTDTHLMSADLLDACGTAPRPGSLSLTPRRENVTCTACRALPRTIAVVLVVDVTDPSGVLTDAAIGDAIRQRVTRGALLAPYVEVHTGPRRRARARDRRLLAQVPLMGARPTDVALLPAESYKSAVRRADVIRALKLLQNAAVAPTVISADDAVSHAAKILLGRAPLATRIWP